MILVQFVRYQEEPIACEGDDQNAELIEIVMPSCPILIDKKAMTLMTERGGYIQFWDKLPHCC